MSEAQIDGAFLRKPYTQVIISRPSSAATCEKDKLPLGSCCFHERITIEVIKLQDSNYSIGTCFSDKTSYLGCAASTQTSISSPIWEPSKTLQKLGFQPVNRNQPMKIYFGFGGASYLGSDNIS